MSLSLQNNQLVRIEGERGVVIGRVEDVRAVAEMPDLPETGLPAEGEFAPRAILREMGVERVAMISYHYAPDSEVMFAALAVGDKWFDLERQELTIDVVGPCG